LKQQLWRDTEHVNTVPAKETKSLLRLVEHAMRCF
jgi:hypothetical protein